MRRLQALTVREAPVYRLFRRATLRVETAGGGGQPGTEQQTRQREPLAPLVRREDVSGLVQHVLPDVDLRQFDWQPPHPGAFRRAVKPALVLAFLMSAMAAGVIHWRAVYVSPLIVLWMVIGTRQALRHMGWAVSDNAVAFRSGWLWRSITVVPLARVATGPGGFSVYAFRTGDSAQLVVPAMAHGAQARSADGAVGFSACGHVRAAIGAATSDRRTVKIGLREIGYSYDLPIVIADGRVRIGLDAVAAGSRPRFVNKDSVWSWTETTRKVDGCSTAFIIYTTKYAIPRLDYWFTAVTSVTYEYKEGRWLVIMDQGTLLEEHVGNA